jgi:glycosyltransferase involved in cell wall biosynthesis
MHEHNDTLKKIKVARIVSIPNFFVHSIANFIELQKNGFELDLICSEEKYGEYLKKEYGFNVIYCNIEREISLLEDLKSLYNLYKIIRKNKYTIVHSATPKAGILSAVAAFLARSPIRLHTFTGQRWVTLHGAKKKLLVTLDKIIIMLNTQSYTDSPSQVDFLVEEKITKRKNLICLGQGSFGGVNLTRFNRSLYPAIRNELAEKFQIKKDHPWILFVGRLTKDKGINELVRAFIETNTETPCSLILVGNFESRLDPIESDVENSIKTHPHIHYLGFQENPAAIMAACDLMCLPSYREGFGTVVIEAAACELPTIGTDIVGLKDAIINNETGLLVPSHDQDALKIAMMKLLKDESLRKKLGSQARDRAIKNFDTKIISLELIESYKKLLRGLNN